MAIDFEVVHYGDPSFDAAFLLNHLLLKSLNLPALAASMRALARRFWTALMSTLGSGWDWFEAATIEHLGCLLLARVDGKSPVEYITRHEEKESVRNLARRIILEPPQSIADIFPWESGAGWHPARRLPPAGVPTLRIAAVHALEILDSRGNPTVSVSMELSDGTRGAAQVPSGASTGKHEAVELRDGDPDRYAGKGVLRAVASVNEILGPAIRGMDAEDQKALDARLIEIDGTPDKSRLGANAILGISCAAARAVACSRRIPLWRSLPSGQKPMLPTPMVNMISGGLHAGRRIEVQDFLVVPRGFSTLGEALEAIVKIHRATEGVLLEQGYTLTGVADEGGWGPALESNEAALQVLADGIDRTGFEERFSIAIDVAASHFHQDGRYELSSENRTLSSGEMIEMFERWIADYPVTSIEDGLEEDDWHGWRVLTHKIGSRVQLVGDDLFTTNPSRLHYGIGIGAANAVLVKMNQIGTLTETFRVVDLARRAGYTAVISARSGETEDSFLADLAVACGSGQIKIGSVTRSERLSKYNRLLEIERELARA